VPQVLRLRLRLLWLRYHLLLRVLVRVLMLVAIDPRCVPRPRCCLVALACGYHLVDTRLRSLHLLAPHGRQNGADGILELHIPYKGTAPHNAPARPRVLTVREVLLSWGNFYF
jgi:hypothetical protein